MNTNFDLKKFLIENRLTTNSALLQEKKKDERIFVTGVPIYYNGEEENTFLVDKIYNNPELYIGKCEIEIWEDGEDRVKIFKNITAEDIKNYIRYADNQYSTGKSGKELQLLQKNGIRIGGYESALYIKSNNLNSEEESTLFEVD